MLRELSPLLFKLIYCLPLGLHLIRGSHIRSIVVRLLFRSYAKVGHGISGAGPLSPYQPSLNTSVQNDIRIKPIRLIKRLARPCCNIRHRLIRIAYIPGKTLSRPSRSSQSVRELRYSWEVRGVCPVSLNHLAHRYLKCPSAIIAEGLFCDNWQGGITIEVEFI